MLLPRKHGVLSALGHASSKAGACVRTTVGAVTNLQETNAGQGGRPTAQ